MKKATLWARWLCVALVLAAFTPNAQAVELISNLPGNDGTQSADLDELRNKGMGFTMPGDQYVLDSAVLRLETFGPNVLPVVQIWNDVGGNPGVPLITLDNPVFAASGIASYEFTPPSMLILTPNETYWLVAYGQAGGDRYDWKASSPAQTPTGIATHAGAKFDTNGAPPTNNSSILCSYAVNGSPGPISVEGVSWGRLKSLYHD